MEPEDIKRFQREIRAMLAKASHDAAAFAQVVAIVDGARRELPFAAARLIDDGFSWADIGRELKTTRQAAHKRFGPQAKLAATAELVAAAGV